jgi:hypothetical protein
MLRNDLAEPSILKEILADLPNGISGVFLFGKDLENPLLQDAHYSLPGLG